MGNERFLHPLRPRSLSTDWRTDPKQERREKTLLEKNLKKKNSRTG
jgi:hypothetical protein